MSIFPVAVGYRMAWDRDGSEGFSLETDTGPIDVMSSGTRNSANKEENVAWIWTSNITIGVIFPELRNIEGYYFGFQGGITIDTHVQTSVDTTNGMDGVWVDHGVAVGITRVNGSYRSGAQSISVVGVKALRMFRGAGGALIETLHLYGVPTTLADQLMIWDPVLDQQLAIEGLDPGLLGAVTRGNTYSQTFRVKNVSGALTATDTIVSRETLKDNTPSVLSGMSFSIDGNPYVPTITIATLAPGAISDVITLQYVVPANAELQINNPRVVAAPTTYA